MTASLKLSVIISTYNRRDVLISRCLPSVFAQDLPIEQFEVIVIVDGSTDGTLEALRELDSPCTLRVVDLPNGGLSKARNHGIQIANGALVMFLDDDIICEPDVFRLHVEAHTGEDSLVVHGAINQAPGLSPSILGNANVDWYLRYNSRLASHGGAIWPEGVFLISNSSMPRQVLIDCGGLDEDLPAMDDFELGLRLWKQKIAFKYLPNAVAYELSVKSWRAFLFRDGEAFGRSEVLLCRKHPDYRTRSGLLSGLGRTPATRRFLRRMFLQSPVSLANVLTVPIWACEKFCRIPVMQRLGLRLLGFGRRITELEGALRTCGSWSHFKNEFAMRLPVLLYHHVGPVQPGTHRSLTVSPRQFERQVRCLVRKGYRGISASDWLRWRLDGKGLPEKPVLFTFDDGYADLAQHAFPILQEAGFKAAVYIVTGRIDGTNTWDEERGSGTHRLLSADQILYWVSRGVEFGAHSRTHAELTTLQPQELEDEVAGSKIDLEKLLGHRVVSFAYPFGFHNHSVVECVRRVFDLAVGISPRERGINHLLTDPCLLQRSMVQTNDSALDVAHRVAWGYSPFQSLRARLRLRSRAKQLVDSILGKPADRIQ
jgi:glycosyltransferase involved in cell wall biosynthesis/peptidoglycan/xylan/chitin deacetylase (PgdA/CDA1 family)